MTATADPITFAGDRMSVRFSDFGPDRYALFLKVKALPESETAFDPATEAYTVTAPARFAALLGAAPPARARAARLAPYLFPDQRLLTRQALDAKRFALWCQCGYGKTPMGLEYARQVARLTGGRVLVVTLNEIVGEWQGMAERFYAGKLPLHRIRTRADLREWCEHGEPGVGITNYEKFNPDPDHGPVVNECRHLAGVVLDEASRLRAGGGKQKWSLIKSCKGVEYKLTLTATPAPNDLMEFASQAAFLEKMRTESDIIWTFFTRDPRTQKWAVKPHARAAFFRWMASWSVYVADPRRYGWRLDLPAVPDPVYQVVEVPPTAEQLDLARRLTADAATGQQTLFGGGPVGVVGRGKLSQAAKGFQYRPEFRRVDSLKPARVAEIVRQEHARGAQTLVWTLFDAETAILADLLAGLPGVDVLSGKVQAKARPAVIDRFRSGESRVLISKAKLLGYGLNFQCCDAMVFSGFSDCYDQETELLTAAGWKSFGEVKVGEAVATVNPATRAFEWQAAERVVWEPYRGPMLAFRNASFDLLVTPNHKLFVQRCPDRFPAGGGEWSLRYAADLATNYRRQEWRMLSAAAGFAGPAPASVPVPPPEERTRNYHSRVVSAIPAEDLMRLAGWYLTEGYCRPLDSNEAGRIVICQTDSHPDHRREIIDLMTRLGLSVNSNTKDITGYSLTLAGYLIDTFGSGSHHKRIPRWVKNLDGRLLTILRDTMLKGDGCTVRGGVPHAYRTVSKGLADDFQELCLKTGVRGSVVKRPANRQYQPAGGYCYDVNVAWKNTRPSIHHPPEPVDYDGMIGCVTVPNHTVIVRRKGIPVVSGNSFEDLYQCVRRAVRFGQAAAVRVYFPVVRELEGEVFDNLDRKQRQFLAAVAEMERAYIDARAGLKGVAG